MENETLSSIKKLFELNSNIDKALLDAYELGILVGRQHQVEKYEEMVDKIIGRETK